MARNLQVEHPGEICKSGAGGMNMTKPLTDTFPSNADFALHEKRKRFSWT